MPKRLDQRETTTKKSRIFVDLTGDLCRFKNINDSNIAGDFTEKIEFLIEKIFLTELKIEKKFKKKMDRWYNKLSKLQDNSWNLNKNDN